mgnify:CR=1 FL=1
MTKKGRKKRFLRSFFVNVYECEQKFIFTDKNIDKVNKKKVRYLYVQNKKQKLKIMKKGGVKTSEDGEIINDCFLLNEYKRLFWREK